MSLYSSLSICRARLKNCAWQISGGYHKFLVTPCNKNFSNLAQRTGCSQRKFHHHLPKTLIPIQTQEFCTSTVVDDITYEQVSEETLEALSDFLEELVEDDPSLQDADVLYSTGVLTLQLGKIGTYVINKQSPNKQIWLSSPFSGPKRYDFINSSWIYKHDGITLHDLLSKELSSALKKDIDLSTLVYGSESS